MNTKTNTKTLNTAASPWGTSVSTRERFGVAPESPLQGGGVPTARLAGATFSGYGSNTGTAILTDKHAAMTLAAVRQDDARVPEPRGRKR